MKTFKTVFLLALSLAMVLASGLVVSAQGGIAGTTWDTGFQIQNIGDAIATVDIEFYDADGGLVHTDTRTVAVGGNVTVYVPGDYSDEELPQGKYSVVL